MKSSLRKILALVLAGEMFLSLVPGPGGVALAQTNQQAEAGTEILAGEAEPEARDAQPDETSSEEAPEAPAREAEFSYRLTEDGTAEVTGCNVISGSVSLPRSLGGAAVTSIAPGAFAEGVSEITIHGNVMRISEGAIPAGTRIACRQGTFAAEWAAENACSVRSLTEGELYPGVEDMTDALDEMEFRSDTEIVLDAVSGRRLDTGDRFLVNYGDNNEKFYKVTARQQEGDRVVLSVLATDIGEVFSYREYVGKKRTAMSFTVDGKSAGNTRSSSEDGAVLAGHEITHSVPSKDIALSKEVSFTVRTTVTSSFRVVVKNGQVISGSMVTDQEDKHTITVTAEKPGKFEEILDNWYDLAGEVLENDGYSGPPTRLPLIESIGMELEIKPKAGWKVGGSGSYTWTSRTLCTYEYSRSWGKWVLKDKKGLDGPDPYWTSVIYGKVYAKMEVCLKVGWVTTVVKFTVEAGLKLELTLSTEPEKCMELTFTQYAKMKLQIGLWLDLGLFEIKAVEAAGKDFTLFESKPISCHFSVEQGLHFMWNCIYEPMDYSIRYSTGIGWIPDSRCYLQTGTYTLGPAELKLFTVKLNEHDQIETTESAIEFENISYIYEDHPEALDWKMEQPKYRDKEVRWLVREPATSGDYYWNDDLTVRENLEEVLGKPILNEDMLPKKIVLEADWSDKLMVTYDARGGKFQDETKTKDGLLTQYYVAGDTVRFPDDKPVKKLAEFTGWTTDPEGNHAFQEGTEVTENLTVYAQYRSYDPTNHSSANSIVDGTPTLIGNAVCYGAETLKAEIRDGFGRVLNPSDLAQKAILEAILDAGCGAYQSADGQGISFTSSLGNVRGKLVSVDQLGNIGISLIGLVDPSVTYDVFVIPSTINDLPVIAEAGLLQNLRAKTVVFSGSKGAVYVEQTAPNMFSGNTYVEKVYMDTTSIVKLGDGAFEGCTSLTEVSLPPSMQEIGENAFKGCTGLTKAVFGSWLDTVGEYAFSDCFNLTEVTVNAPYPNTMRYAFSDTGAGTAASHINLSLGRNVLTLPAHVFEFCHAVKSFTVANDSQLREIGNSAFYACTNLRQATLQVPGGDSALVGIGNNAFSHTGLTEIEIPASMPSWPTAINAASEYHNHIFFNTSLKKITIGGTEGIRTISANMFVNAMGHSTLEEIVLREGVTAIGAQAFKSQFPNLQKVTLPSTLETIGSEAFARCYEMARISVSPNDRDGLVLPESVKSIGTRAFCDCCFTCAEIPGTVQEISEGAFSTNRSLKSIKMGEGIRTIGKKAFAETGLQEVEIPASVTFFYTPGGGTNSYLDNVFYGTPIKKVTIGGRNGITTVSQYMLINQSAGSSVDEIVLRPGVTEIGSYAFKGMDSLKMVTLPMTLKTIGVGAFQQCTGLIAAGLNPYTERGLILPERLTTLSSYAFAGCSSLVSAEIPGTVSIVWDHAFYGSRSLSRVRMGEGVTSIGQNAFANTNIQEIEIPASVTGLVSPNDSGAVFYGTPLKKITIGGPNGITQIGQILKSGTVSGTATLEEVILREGVTMICDYAFANQDSLKSVIFPDTLNYIGDSAFSNCHDFVIYYRNATWNSGRRAFAGAYNYKYVQLTGENTVTVTFLDEMGTDGAEALTAEVEPGSLLVEPEAPFHVGWTFMGWSAGAGKDLWNFAKDRVGISDLTLTAQWERESLNGVYRIEGDHAVLLSYTLDGQEGTAVTLPRSYRGVPVTRIADGAFAGQRIQVLTLPAEVEDITWRTFEGADELYWIKTPSGCLNYLAAANFGWLFTPGFKDLIYCPPGNQFQSVNLSSIETIAPFAIRGQSILKNVTLASVTEIGEGAFMGCTGLTELNLPDSLLQIGPLAYYGCEGLTSVSGAAGCVSIGENAFGGIANAIFYGEEDSELVLYAKANGLAWNIYTVTCYTDGTEVTRYRAQAGEAVPMPSVAAGEGRMLQGWYRDEEYTDSWSFETDRMPRSDLSLYSKTLPLFDTEDYSVTEGEETTVLGVRITGYHGAGTDIRIPETIGESTVRAVNASAFRAGCVLRLPGALMEIDVESFTAARITLFAPSGSDTERLLLEAGYEPNAQAYALRFETNGGALVDERSVTAGDEILLPETVRDGCSFGGWFTDPECTLTAGMSQEPFRMPETDVTLYAAWTGTPTVYPFLWKQEGNRIIVTGSKGLASVSIPETINGLRVEEIADYAFMNDSNLSVISLPDGLQTIGMSAFRGTGLSRVSLPETVTSVGDFVFSACEKLTGAAWSPLAEVPAGAFYGDRALMIITWAEGITQIGRSALEGCLSVTELTLPDSVESIGAAAFRNMSSLRKLTIGRNTAKIDGTALDSCGRLERIQAPAENTTYVTDSFGVLYYADWSGLVRYPAGRGGNSYMVKAGTVLLETHAFGDTARLKAVTLPDSLGRMGQGVFRRSGITRLDLSGAAGLTELPDEACLACVKLSEVILGSTLTSIGDECFLDCPSLLSLDIPDSVESIGYGAFDAGTLLIGGAESFARRYAAKNGLPFRARGWVEVPAVSISIPKETIVLQQGVAWRMPAEVFPENSTDELEWISGDEELLRTDDGLLRPLQTGETVMTLRAGAVEREVAVRITDTPIEIVQEPQFFMPDQSAKLTVRFITDNYSEDRINWIIQDPAETKRTNGTLNLDRTGKYTVSAKALLGEATENRTYYVLTSQGILSFPAALTEIESEAFSGDNAITSVFLPDNISSVGNGAFADCGNLWFVFVPDHGTGITAEAFSGSPHVILVCREGSEAAAEAADTGLEVFLTAP